MIDRRQGSAFVGLIIIIFFVVALSAFVFKNIGYQYDIIRMREEQHRLELFAQSYLYVALVSLVTEKDFISLQGASKQYTHSYTDYNTMYTCSVTLTHIDEKKIQAVVKIQNKAEILHTIICDIVYDNTYTKKIIAFSTV